MKWKGSIINAGLLFCRFALGKEHGEEIFPRQAHGPTKFLFNRYRGRLPQRVKRPERELTTRLYLSPRLRIRGAITPLRHMPLWCAQGEPYLYLRGINCITSLLLGNTTISMVNVNHFPAPWNSWGFTHSPLKLPTRLWILHKPTYHLIVSFRPSTLFNYKHRCYGQIVWSVLVQVFLPRVFIRNNSKSRNPILGKHILVNYISTICNSHNNNNYYYYNNSNR